ncbi:Uncharacterised protein at_DN0693 [Pycnogonum litorale]
MNGFRRLLMLAVVGFLAVFTYAAEDESMNEVEFENVKKIALTELENTARFFFDDEYDDGYNDGKNSKKSILSIVGIALLSSVIGTFLGNFMRLSSSNGNTGVVAPTTGTVMTTTTNLLPIVGGRKRRSIEFYKHPVLNDVSKIPDSTYESVDEYIKRNRNKY